MACLVQVGVLVSSKGLPVVRYSETIAAPSCVSLLVGDVSSSLKADGDLFVLRFEIKGGLPWTIFILAY